MPIQSTEIDIVKIPSSTIWRFLPILPKFLKNGLKVAKKGLFGDFI